MKNKRFLLLVIVFLCGMALCSCGGEAADTTTVADSTEQGTTVAVPMEEGLTRIRTTARILSNGGRFEGWGTGIAWWGNRLGYSDSLMNQAIKLFFDEETGLGMNIVRYNIPGGDDSAHTHIKRADAKLEGFMQYNEETGNYEFNSNADANQRALLLKIKEFVGDRLITEAYASSPPYYMTVSGCTSGSDKGITNNIEEECFDDYSDYVIKVLKAYREGYGLEFDSISIINEPKSDMWIAMRSEKEGFRLHPSELAGKLSHEFLTALGKEGFSGFTGISIDDESDNFSRLAGLAQIQDTVSKANVHTGNGLSEAYSEKIGFIKKCNGLGMDLWITEGDTCLMHKKCEGEMSAALFFAQKIISDLGGMMPSAWMVEEAIAYHVSADGYKGLADTGMPDTTGGYYGLAVADHDNDRIILTKKYYTYGQFSRYIRPGYTIFADNNDNVLVTYSEDEERLVIVAVNNTRFETDLKVSFEYFDYAGGTAKVIRTSGDLATGENWAELPDVEAAKDVFRTKLKEYSVTTFIIDDIKVKQ